MSDVQPVVIDNGTGIIKAGFAGEEAPKVVFRNVVGRPKHKRVMVGGALESDVYVPAPCQLPPSPIPPLHPRARASSQRSLVCNRRGGAVVGTTECRRGGKKRPSCLALRRGTLTPEHVSWVVQVCGRGGGQPSWRHEVAVPNGAWCGEQLGRHGACVASCV